MIFPVSGQFDDIEELDETLTNLNIENNVNNNNNNNGNYHNKDIISSDESDEVDNALDNYIDYEKDLDHETSKAALNIASFEEKVDLSFKNRSRTRVADKSDSATSERVLDSRSMKIMYKMMRHKEFETVNGCISAGKEANVYHAPSCSGEDLVLKVYMTAIMPFKARQKYMRGDNRFKNISTSSSSKLIKTWAEKEFRNLRRMWDTGGLIACPRPIKQTGMVVLMSMIGRDGVGAPRLKDVTVESADEWRDMYVQVVAAVRVMYHQCHLVHADLSEYNLLYHDKRVYVIDVSQSVEHEHPEAFNFLRKDCHTVNSFFRNKEIETLSLQEFFFFVIDVNSTIEPTNADFLPSISRLISTSTFSTNSEEEGYFLDCFLERSLGNIQGEQIHDQYKQLLRNPDYVHSLPWAKVIGLEDNLRNIRANKIQSIKKHKRTLRKKEEQLRKELNGEEEDEQEEESVEQREEKEEETVEAVVAKVAVRPKNEDLESKKMRKKAVKEEKKETRIQQKKDLLEKKFRTIPGFKYKNMTPK